MSTGNEELKPRKSGLAIDIWESCKYIQIVFNILGLWDLQLRVCLLKQVESWGQGSWWVERKVKFIERKKILREKNYEIFRRQKKKKKKVSKGREWSIQSKVSNNYNCERMLSKYNKLGNWEFTADPQFITQPC